jgi:hypothetical protein
MADRARIITLERPDARARLDVIVGGDRAVESGEYEIA